MEKESLRALIKSKLTDGSLPHDSIPRMWSGSGNGEICDACSLVIEKAQFVMEGSADVSKRTQLHVQCFFLWDAERTTPGRGASRGLVRALPEAQRETRREGGGSPALIAGHSTFSGSEARAASPEAARSHA
jgi:hypothetical protein